jgi:peroxiredoxin Q/BCP
MTIDAGDMAPDFELETDGGSTLRLSDFKGRKVVVYFYPKDDTPGCTRESCDFRDKHPDFSGAGAEIIGISRDGVDSHDKFKAKFDLNFPLAADPDLEAIKAFDVWRERTRDGKTTMGVERSTFLIDESGKIARAWRKVDVDGHADEVLAATKG